MWSRTAWLVAIHTGSIEKAQVLLDAGASRRVVGKGGKPALLYAAENGLPRMLEWLLSIGIPLEQVDESGESALIAAVENSDVESVRILLAAGADPARMRFNRPVLGYATHPGIIQVLLDMGVDRADLSPEGSRTLWGYPAEPDYFLSDASEADYRRAPTRRFGSANPERTTEPFWLGMIYAGMSAAEAADLFEYRPKGQPVWSAYRFGQSTTVLRPDLIVQIGGEHEDFYDEDFCIYNDAFVHRGGGAVEVFGYPEVRRPGYAPVYRLSLNDFSTTRIEPSGEGPGMDL